MDITIHQTYLPHNDADASLAFYRDILGFEVRNDVEYGGMHWLTVGPPDQPGTSIVLYPPATTSYGVGTAENGGAITISPVPGASARSLLALRRRNASSTASLVDPIAPAISSASGGAPVAAVVR